MGAAHIPVWLLVPLAILLAVPGMRRDRSLAYRFGNDGSGSMTMFTAATLLNSLVFTAVAYAFGYAVIWLSFTAG